MKYFTRRWDRLTTSVVSFYLPSLWFLFFLFLSCDSPPLFTWPTFHQSWNTNVKKKKKQNKRWRKKTGEKESPAMNWVSLGVLLREKKGVSIKWCKCERSCKLKCVGAASTCWNRRSARLTRLWFQCTSCWLEAKARSRRKRDFQFTEETFVSFQNICPWINLGLECENKPGIQLSLILPFNTTTHTSSSVCILRVGYRLSLWGGAITSAS